MENELSRLVKAASFAAGKHRFQTRKGAAAEPYINHPLEVARILAEVGGVVDSDVLIAAILHDTVEDTETTAEELTAEFGSRVREIVLEVTDDRSLPKSERKAKQIEHAPMLSLEAKLVKMADKISNITDVAANPPHDWSRERRLEYVEWGEKVVAGLRGTNAGLENHYDALTSRAKAAIG